MKLKIRFLDTKYSPIPKIAMIKFYRDVTNLGLRDSKDAIEDMLAEGCDFLWVSTLRPTVYVREVAASLRLRIETGDDTVASGSFSLTPRGKVIFNFSSVGESTTVHMNQAGRVLNEFLQKAGENKVIQKREARPQGKRSKNKKVLDIA